MTTLKTNAIEPEGGTTNLTIGMTGQDVVIGADYIKANTFKDAGGNTLFTSNGSGVLSSVSGLGGVMVLVTTSTASSSANMAFTLTNAYKEYHFEFINIDGASDTQLTMHASSDAGSNYNVSITSTAVYARHTEGGTSGLSYYSSQDSVHPNTSQGMHPDLHSGGDASFCGRVQIYNPSDTTFAKHWQSKFFGVQSSPGAWENWGAGYWNTTSAINSIKFQMNTGNFVDGSKIKMYGIN